MPHKDTSLAFQQAIERSQMIVTTRSKCRTFLTFNLYSSLESLEQKEADCTIFAKKFGMLFFKENSRVSTGIPGYGLRTEMIRKFFPFPLWKWFRKTGIPERFPERFFSVKRKFPERCSGIMDRSGISFRKFPVSGTIGTIITLKSYICKYNTS